MADYLMIESRDPFDSSDVGNFLALAEGLSKAGNKVTLFLVQNGVLPARHGARSAPLAVLAANGVEGLAGSVSPGERGLPPHPPVPGLQAAPPPLVLRPLAARR